MIQVLASEDGIKSVPQARVVDLLDTIEKWVKKKEVRVYLVIFKQLKRFVRVRKEIAINFTSKHHKVIPQEYPVYKDKKGKEFT